MLYDVILSYILYDIISMTSHPYCLVHVVLPPSGSLACMLHRHLQHRAPLHLQRPLPSLLRLLGAAAEPRAPQHVLHVPQADELLVEPIAAALRRKPRELRQRPARGALRGAVRLPQPIEAAIHRRGLASSLDGRIGRRQGGEDP